MSNVQRGAPEAHSVQESRGSGRMSRLFNKDLRACYGNHWNPKIAASTIGGFVTEKLERIPRAGDMIDWKGYQIEVLRADRRRAKLLRIRKK